MTAFRERVTAAIFFRERESYLLPLLWYERKRERERERERETMVVPPVGRSGS
jgi:hypothetical protein